MWILSSTTQAATVLSFLLSALQRYLTIVHNKTPRIFKRQYLPFLLLSIWILAFILVLPFLTTFGELYVMYWPDLCYIELSTVIWNIGNVLYALFVVVPMISVLGLYIHIIIIIRRAAKIRQGQSTSNSTNKSHKTAMILFILYITFSVGFVPYILRSAAFALLGPSMEKYVYLFIWYFYMIVCMINPILYSLLFNQIKQAYMQIIRCKRKKVLQEGRVDISLTSHC